MSSNESHHKLLNKVYHDPAGYGAITSTFKQAFEQDKPITLKTVKQWFNSNLETTKQIKGSNSFIAPYPYNEYQLELMFFSDLKIQKLEQGMLCLISGLIMQLLFLSKAKEKMI